MKTIILASNSIARKILLENSGFNVIVKATNIEETSFFNTPEEIVVDLAKQKLNAYIKKYGIKHDYPVLCADTMIFYKNKLIGKAKDRNEAYSTLKNLSNDTHKIYSSYSLLLPNGTIKNGYDEVDITFENLSDLSIMDYLETEEWKGAAGSYRIQGKGKSFVKEINGEFNIAVGLPLKEISDLIRLS